LCRHVEARPGETFALHYGKRTGGALLVMFAALLAAAYIVAPAMPLLGQVAGGFYRAGALVFGGGHVVLPLLKQAVVDPGWIDNDTFLTGYGAAQAVPGPMFTLAAFLGERLREGQGGMRGAAVSMAAMFLPGLLLIAGALPFWQTLAAQDNAARILAGVNAAVVGVLAAALYNPVWISAIHDVMDFVIALSAFLLLAAAQWPALAIVGGCVVAALLRTASTL
jgi:chromate transporter